MSARSVAEPAVVYRLLGSIDTWPLWQPFISATPVGGDGSAKAGTTREPAIGDVWELRDRLALTVIELVEVVPDSRIGYITRRLVGAHDYRAEIEVAAAPGGGSVIRWRGSYRPTVAGQILRWWLPPHMRKIVKGLAQYAGDLQK
ncbi:SRPBCC family protein [Actinoplanes sp. M2I2]|uniref:SRPBCC family protein n=1 Tax=Actinoplanes sp. M2I2 TaxID=1734444 RepID=UPI002021FE51|nr:SRPBCC family protein [Actinoplanes sp. M2I2]